MYRLEPAVRPAPPICIKDQRPSRMQCCRAATGVREMGVFARWPVFEKPEVVLERRLQENPVYPFQEETSGTSESTAAGV